MFQIKQLENMVCGCIFIFFCLYGSLQAATANAPVQKPEYGKFQQISPLDMTTLLVSEDTEVRPGVFGGTEYSLFRDLVNLPDQSIKIHSQSASYFVGVAVKSVSLVYSRQD